LLRIDEAEALGMAGEVARLRSLIERAARR
jgi:hypothetical protein